VKPKDGKKAAALETAYGYTGGEKLWRAKPQERIRYEIRPAGTWRMKASRGRENPRTQVVMLWKRGCHAAAERGETL